jgi:hypothetical protein
VIKLYDPRTNTLTETTYEKLAGITGMSIGSLKSSRSRESKLRKLNCYIMRDGTTLKQRKKWYEMEKFPDEAWKTIRGSDGKYFISTYGRVKRIFKNGSIKLKLPYLHPRGHLQVKVLHDGVYKHYKISKLVGLHFLGAPKPGQVLRHKNGIKTDDFAGNLEYVAPEVLGKKTGYLSKSKPVVQLDSKTKEVIGEFRSSREAARNCYLSPTAIQENCKGKYKTAGGYVFMYADEYEGGVY